MSLVTDTVDLTSRLNLSMATAIASAPTPDISASNGNSIRITGTTGITGFAAASQAGITRTLVFNDAVLLTNSATLALFGSANITTVAGDIFVFLAETTTTWIMIGFHRPSAITNGQTNSAGILNGAITSVKISDAAIIPSKTMVKAVTALADADATLTASQLLSGLFTITPSAARNLTTDTAVAIIATLTGYQTGTNYEFTIINDQPFSANLIGGVGVSIVGNITVLNESTTYLVRVTAPTTVSIYRKS